MLKVKNNEIKIAMANAGLNISDLAKIYGCTPQRMWVIINGTRANTKTVGRIAKALGCDVTEIIDTN